MKNTVFKATIYKMAEEDTYSGGCLPETCQNYGVVDEIMALTTPLLLEKIKQLYGVPYIFEDRLEFCRMENARGEAPNGSEIGKWQKDELEMWAARYSIYICRQETDSLGNGELSEFFKELENEG